MRVIFLCLVYKHVQLDSTVITFLYIASAIVPLTITPLSSREDANIASMDAITARMPLSAILASTAISSVITYALDNVLRLFLIITKAHV